MLRRALITFMLVAASVTASGCSASRRAQAEFQGNVVDETVIVATPALVSLTPDIQAGLGDSPAAPTASKSATTSVIARTTRIGSVARVDEVMVAEGDRVEAGDVLLRFDDDVLADSVAASGADLAYARARTRALLVRLDDVESAQETIADTTATLARTISDVQATRARLVSQLATARSGLSQLKAAERQLVAALAQFPGGVPPTLPPGPALPPGTPDPAALQAQLAQVRAQIAQVTAGIAQLEAAIVQLDAGLAKAGAAQDRLASAGSTASSAENALGNAVELSELGTEAARVALDLARQQKALATLRSPANGVIVTAPSGGDVLAPGATAVALRPDAPVRVRVWLDAEQARDVSLGDEALVSADSASEPVSGRVTLIGEGLDFPPTSLSTSVIHLIRAVPVEVTLDSDAGFVPGTPVDLSFERK